MFASRFSEVAELVSVCWLEIKGGIKSGTLSEKTLYGAYLVFKQRSGGAYGFYNQPVEVSVEGRRRTVYLEEAETPRRPREQIVPGIFSRVRSRFLDSFDAEAMGGWRWNWVTSSTSAERRRRRRRWRLESTRSRVVGGKRAFSFKESK